MPSEKFNAGESLVLGWCDGAWPGGGASLASCLDGRDKPGRPLQIASLVHLAGAVLFMLGALGLRHGHSAWQAPMVR